MAVFDAEYQQRIADIDVAIAEVELLRTRQGDIPLPPKVPGKNASKEELQQYVTDQDNYEAAVKRATQQQQEIDVLHGERNLTKAQATQQGAYARISNKVGQTKQSAQKRLSTTNKWLANIPTPGGVWLPFLLLMFFFLALFPVNGHTRLKWLFLVIIGQAGFNPVEPTTGWKPVPKHTQNNNGNGNSNQQVLYNQNTNPNQTPGKILTSIPLLTQPTQQPTTLIPFSTMAGTTNYVDSLFSSGF